MFEKGTKHILNVLQKRSFVFQSSRKCHKHDVCSMKIKNFMVVSNMWQKDWPELPAWSPSFTRVCLFANIIIIVGSICMFVVAPATIKVWSKVPLHTLCRLCLRENAVTFPRLLLVVLPPAATLCHLIENWVILTMFQSKITFWHVVLNRYWMLYFDELFFASFIFILGWDI